MTASTVAPSGGSRTSESSEVLRVDDLRTGFTSKQGTVWVVNGVSFVLRAGQVLGIVGESGSGKTMLARSVMGLLPEHGVAQSGQVRLNGREVSSESPRERRASWGSEISMVFQNPMTSLNPVVKIGRQLTESLELHLGLRRREATERAIELLRAVRIAEPERRFKVYPHQLSGGMRQRVSIAIAVACDPTVLIADEPTTALDVTVQAQILDLLETQCAERNMAMILVTHDLGVVADRTDEIVVMYGGQVVERAPTSLLFTGMRMHYTRALLNSIPRLDDPSHTRLTAIVGHAPDPAHPPRGCRFAPRCPAADDRCHAELPPLEVASSPDHLVRCWHPLDPVAAVPAGTAVAGAGAW